MCTCLWTCVCVVWETTSAHGCCGGVSICGLITQKAPVYRFHTHRPSTLTLTLTQTHTHTEDTNTPMGLQNVTTPCLPVLNNTTVSNQRASCFLVLFPKMKPAAKGLEFISSKWFDFLYDAKVKLSFCIGCTVCWGSGNALPFEIWLEIYTKHPKCVFVCP